MELVILVGLPAAGKSTFFREHLAATHVLVSKDTMPRSANKEKLQREQVLEGLRAGRSLAVDNVNAAAKDRAWLIEQGHAHGARVVGYFFEATPAECLARNRTRVGPACVPAVAIFTAAKRLDAPQASEGFDALFRVRVHNKDEHFEVISTAEETAAARSGGQS